MSLNSYAAACHHRSKEAGWWDFEGPVERFAAVKVALIHSEISEVLEGLRRGLDHKDDHLPHRSSVEVELADALIRIFDLAGGLGVDLDGAYADKLAYNAARADHKQENRQAAGGKKF